MRKADVTIIRLQGSCRSLDVDAIEELGGVLLTEAATADPPAIVVDMSEASYIGSMFIELLVRAWKRVRQRGGNLVLCNVRPFCAEVFSVTRLDHLWVMYDDVEAALVGVFEDKEQ